MRLLICITLIAQLGNNAGGPGGEYNFVLDTERMVGIDKSDCTEVGKLDKNGVFTVHYKRTFSTAQTGEKFSIGGGPGYARLNITGPYPAKAFEFRSGNLHPGVMEEGGRFVPDANGKVVSFSNYRYSPVTPPIWNLPGYFRPKPQPKNRAMDP